MQYRSLRILSFALAGSLVVVLPAPAQAMALQATPVAAVAEPPAEVEAARASLASLASRLGDLATTPYMSTSLPVTGQAPTDVLGLSTLFSRSIGQAMADFRVADDNESFEDLVVALNDAGVAGLGIDATATESPAGSGKWKVALEIGGATASGDLYSLYAGETGTPAEALFIDGTPSPVSGTVPATAEVAGTLTLDVDTTALDDPAQAVTLDPASKLEITVDATRDDLGFRSRYGFTDLSVSGSADYHLGVDVAFSDPDGVGGITRGEWQQTLIGDLTSSTVTDDSSAAVDLDLDSSLVEGSGDGALGLDLGGAEIVPASNGDGTYAYDEPTVTVGQGLHDFTKVTASDAIVGLAQLAATYSTAQARMDPQLPFLDKRVSELASAVTPLNTLVEAQGSAAVICGRVDSSPPAATNLPGTTWYCQARTADPVVAGSVEWSVDSSEGTIEANGASDDTVGTNPTKNVMVTGSETEPNLTVSFDVEGTEGDATFTAQRRAQTAQELMARLNDLTGTTATASYDTTTRALAYDIAVATDPAATELPITIGDLFRPDARLRGVTTDDKATVDLGRVALNATYGLLLGPDAGTETTLSDRAFLQVDPDGREMAVDAIDVSADSFDGAGSVGYLAVDAAGSELSVASEGLSADIATGDTALDAGADEEIANAALLVDVLNNEVDGIEQALTGHVNLDYGSTLSVTAAGVLDNSYDTSVHQLIDMDTPATGPAPLPDVTTTQAYDTWVKSLDTTPQVSGRSSNSDESQVSLFDAAAHFETGDLGIDFTGLTGADRVVNASLFNLTTGASCPRFEVVSDTRLRCVDVEPEGGIRDGAMSGGKVRSTDPDDLSDDDDDANDFDPDNTWHSTDEYVVEGDPEEMRGIVLGSLYDLANGIEQSSEKTWNAALPLLDVTPRDVTPQLAEIRELASTLNNIADEVVKTEDCPDTGCPDADELTQSPPNLQALETLLEEKVDALATKLDADAGAADRVTIESTNTASGLGEGEEVAPHLVVRITLPASGTAEAPISIDLDPLSYWLRSSADPAGVEAAWSSTVNLDLAVPLSPDLDPSGVKVLPTTGVSDLHVSVDSEEVDLTGSLGPVNVAIGQSAVLTGAHTEVGGANTFAPVRDATVTFAGTNAATGDNLTDPVVDFHGIGANGATVTNTTQSLECTLGASTPENPHTAACPFEAAEGETAPAWAAGDLYTVSYTSTTTLVDTDLATSTDGGGPTTFGDLGVEPGMLVVTSTGDGATREDVGTCVIGTVADHHLVCESALTGAGASFETDTRYRVLETTRLYDDNRVPLDSEVAADAATWSFDDLTAALRSVTDTSAPVASCAPTVDDPDTEADESAGTTASTLECAESSRTGDGTVAGWDVGEEYRLDFGDAAATLVDLGVRFDEQNLVGQVVTNTTDGSTCTVASATRHTLTCDGVLVGGADNTWQADDTYEVGGLSTAKADLTYALNADVAPGVVPTVDAYVAGLAGSLSGPATAPSCGNVAGAGSATVSGDACALLSVAILPGQDPNYPDGYYLGVVRFTADADGGTSGGGGPAMEVTTSEGITELESSQVTLGFDLTSVAVEQLGAAVQHLLDGTVVDEPLPLLGYDATGGSWLRPALEDMSFQLDQSLPNGEVPADATVGDIDGDPDNGAKSLTTTVEDAVNTAVDNLQPADGVVVDLTLAELIGDVAVTLTCDGEACAADDPLSAVDDLHLRFTLGDNLASAGTAPTKGCSDESCGEAVYQVPFSAGPAGLPISGDFNVNSTVGWKLTVDVGVDRATGPYVNLSDKQMSLGAHAEIPDPVDGDDGCPGNPIGEQAFQEGSPFAGYTSSRCQPVTLGLLQATAYDGESDADRSKLDLGLTLDLKHLGAGGGAGAPSKINAGQLGLLTERDQLVRSDSVNLQADGKVNLYFVTGINPQLAQLQEGSLPSVHGTFTMDFDATETEPVKKIAYDNLYLDGGSFINQFALPVVGGMSDYIKPYKPVIDTVRAPIPVLSDIAMMTGGQQVSLLDVLEKVSGNDLSFIRNVLDVLDVIANVQPVGNTVLIPLGTTVPDYDPIAIPAFPLGSGKFKLLPKQVKSGPCGGAMTPNPTPKASGAQGVGGAGTQPSPAAASQKRYLPKDCASTAKGKGGYRSKTIVTQTEPCDATAGCTGKERARTVTKWTQRPRLTGTALSFPFLEDTSEVFGLLVGEDATVARLDLGTLSASAGIGISFGPFMAGPVPVDIGVGVSVTLGAHLALGYDTLGLRNALLDDPGSFQPDALLDGLYLDDFDAAGNETPEMFVVLTVKLEGAVSVKIFRAGIFGGVSLTIAGDLNDPNGDGKMRIQEIRSFENPMCMFSLSGYLDFFLGVFLEINIVIKTLRFDWEIWRLKPPLKLFEVKCEPKPPVLAQVEDGNLRLNAGEGHAANRHFASAEVKERFRVRQLSALGGLSGGGTRVSVEAFGLYQEHTVPQNGRIVVDAGTARDTLEFLPGVDLQDNEFDFSVPVTARGGAGDDTIGTGSGDDAVDGDAGSDRVSLGSGNDTGNGGEDADTVAGDLGDDTIDGGSGSDNLSGAAGSDTVRGNAGGDTIAGGPGLDQAQLDRVVVRRNALLQQQDPDADLIVATDPEMQALLDGADLLVGGEDDDKLTGHVGNDTLFGDEETGTFRDAACAASVDGGTGADSLDGQVGDDRLAGGPGADGLTGGVGDDTLCGNQGADLLDGDQGVDGTTTGADELRGGDGPDRLYGWNGTDVADGGPGDDLVDGGPDHDALTGGTGADGLTGADGHDIIVGDAAEVADIQLGTPAGVADVGSPEDAEKGTTLAARVTDVTSDDTGSSARVCADRVTVIGGLVDVDGDGSITDADDGRFDGIAIIDGMADIDGSSAIEPADSGVVAGQPVIHGKFDQPADQTVDGVLVAAEGNADCLLGHAGHDALFGGGDGDLIDAGVGHDAADGGSGPDRVRGEQGDDDVRGGAADDQLYGDRGTDLVLGNDGDDTAFGGIDPDQVEGNEGDDTLSGGDGIDDLVGGSSTVGQADGDDVIDGGEGGDRIAGDNAAPARSDDVVVGLTLLDLTGTVAAGADTIRGGPGADLAYGQGGADTMFGQTDDDTSEGGPGPDTVNGDEGADYLVGGSGAHRDADGDVVELAGTPDGSDTINGGIGKDLILGDNGLASSAGSTLFDVPMASDRSSISDTVAAGDTIHGDADSDRIFGQSGNDVVQGGSGADDIAGNAGGDEVSGNDDDDHVTGGSRTAGVVDDETRTVSDTLPASVNDRVHGDAGDDVVTGDNASISTTGEVTLHDVPTLQAGGTLPVGLAGTFGPDLVTGDAGNDHLWGQSGDDRVEGGDGVDTAEGNSGADDVYGGVGPDSLYGGSTTPNVDDRATSTVTGLRGDHLEGGDGEDVVLGDNGSIGRNGNLTNLVPFVTDGWDSVVEEYDVERAGNAARFPNASGPDRVEGDAGEDRLFGQGDDDIIGAGADNDETSGGSGQDIVDGDAGADDLVGGSGQSDLPVDMAGVLDGGDTIHGASSGSTAGDEADVVLGDNGSINREFGSVDPNTGDTRRTSRLYDVDKAGDSDAPHVDASGADDLFGDADRDEVFGQGGVDDLSGGMGDDWLEGNADADVVHGDAGQDDVIGGSSADDRDDRSDVSGIDGVVGAGQFPSPSDLADGNDTLWGDDGDDSVVGDNGRVDRLVDAEGAWTYLTYKGTPLLRRSAVGSAEVEVTGAFGNDIAHGDNGHDEVFGQLGDDTVEGDDGDDVLVGDLGHVATTVNNGRQEAISAQQFISDTAYVDGTLHRETELFPEPTSPTAAAGGGNDLLLGGLGDDALHGGAGDDLAWGNRELDDADLPVVGDTGDLGARDQDVLFGGHGDDSVWGGQDHDHLYGGHGADLLDVVTATAGDRLGGFAGDATIDFKGIDLMYGGWGPDGMQADRSQPSPSQDVDKMVDATGGYNGYFVCEAAYGGHSVMRQLSPSMQELWQTMASSDGANDVETPSSSGWWELGMVFNSDRGENSHPTYTIHPAHFTCDSAPAAAEAEVAADAGNGKPGKRR